MAYPKQAATVYSPDLEVNANTSQQAEDSFIVQGRSCTVNKWKFTGSGIKKQRMQQLNTTKPRLSRILVMLFSMQNGSLPQHYWNGIQQLNTQSSEEQEVELSTLMCTTFLFSNNSLKAPIFAARSALFSSLSLRSRSRKCSKYSRSLSLSSSAFKHNAHQQHQHHGQHSTLRTPQQ